MLPSETGKIVMTHLFEKNAPMTTKEIVEILIEKGDTRFKDITKSPPSNRPPPTTKEKQRNLQLNLNILNKVILNRLEDSGYITRKRVGKYNQIVITPSGEYVASIIGTMK